MVMPVLPDDSQVALLARSFPRLLAMKPSVAARFYQRLAADYPGVYELFKDAEPAGQQQKLLAAMTLLVTNLDQPALLQDYFLALGQRHRQYGVSDDMVKPFTETWLATLKDSLTGSDSQEIISAWRQLIASVTVMMQLTPTPDMTSAGNHKAAVFAHMADLFSQQQHLIAQLSVNATREPASHNLLSDLAKLRLLSSELQTTLDLLTTSS